MQVGHTIRRIAPPRSLATDDFKIAGTVGVTSNRKCEAICTMDEAVCLAVDSRTWQGFLRIGHRTVAHDFRCELDGERPCRIHVVVVLGHGVVVRTVRGIEVLLVREERLDKPANAGLALPIYSRIAAQVGQLVIFQQSFKCPVAFTVIRGRRPDRLSRPC